MSIILEKIASHRYVARLQGHEAEGKSPLSAIHELERVMHEAGLRIRIQTTARERAHERGAKPSAK